MNNGRVNSAGLLLTLSQTFSWNSDDVMVSSQLHRSWTKQGSGRKTSVEISQKRQDVRTTLLSSVSRRAKPVNHVQAIVLACAAGSHSTGAQESCVECQAGYYCPNVGSAEAFPCLSGSFSVGGKDTCTECPAGFSCRQVNGLIQWVRLPSIVGRKLDTIHALPNAHF